MAKSIYSLPTNNAILRKNDERLMNATGLNEGLTGIYKKSIKPIGQLLSNFGTDAKMATGAAIDYALHGKNALPIPTYGYENTAVATNQKTASSSSVPQKTSVATKKTASPSKTTSSEGDLRGHLPMTNMPNVYKGVSKKGNVSYAGKDALKADNFGKSGLSILPSRPVESAPPEIQVSTPWMSLAQNPQRQEAIAKQMKILNMNPSGVSDLMRMKYAEKTLQQLQGADATQQKLAQQQQSLGQQSVDAHNQAVQSRYDSGLKNQGLKLDERRLALSSQPKMALPEFSFIKSDDGSVVAGNKQTGQIMPVNMPSDTERQNLADIVRGKIKTDVKGNPISPAEIERLKAEGVKTYGPDFWL